eukprot:CAMPEP_0119336966 /NCGR_PEP_ID=MMETSP1333-20130426/92960_1 /TAXON_ID=418940 /ORGANISM="Scyphosphaera apsteinii, Strain RCC1455" /LENGTH=57 /DNA_ID=CAMNT_0007347903 /DNA_START=253 /DNA_END=426 /DNA_ORIENTATION=-
MTALEHRSFRRAAKRHIAHCRHVQLPAAAQCLRVAAQGRPYPTTHTQADLIDRGAHT